MKQITLANSMLAPVFVLALSTLAGSARAQELPVPARPPLAPAKFKELATKNATAPCLEPPPLPGLVDYEGPMRKTVGVFARALERKSVREPHYKADAMLCSLDLGDKFLLFVDDSLDPVMFLSAGLDAGIDQASDRDPSFGQGPAGYAKRFGADLADRVSSKFFKDFAYPAIFHEDPRYYRLGQGSAGKRLLHAAEHLFIAHQPDGTRMFNYSEWLGTITSAALTNLYHPGNKHTVGPTARNVSYQFAADIGFDVLREFWPDIARELKLPFRGISNQQDQDSRPNGN